MVYSIAFVGMAVFSLIGWAMITDVIDDTEVKTGERSDGTIYAIYSFSRKLGQAAASGISGFLLSAIGYTTATQFDPEVTKGIYNVTCLVPVQVFSKTNGTVSRFHKRLSEKGCSAAICVSWFC